MKPSIFSFGLLLITTLILTKINGSSIGKSELKADTNWWKNTIVYQIYPKSFKDSDGDGMGDIKGIISKLDYLQDLGVGAIWLSPIFKSPQADSGYDISDFRDVEPMLGTLDDVKLLKKECSERDLKLILDFVPNHSSNEHDWFKKALNNEEPYVDYYIWKSKKADDSSPNNWQSVFGGSAWECGGRQDDTTQCYLHQFAIAQPDLNYRNDKVNEEMKEVLRFWINEVGVDGYRMDAVPHLVEDKDFTDEVPDPNDPNVLIHNKTQNLPETYEIIKSFRDVLDEFGDKLMMTEAYGTIDQMIGYYGTEDHLGAHFSFNFQLISNLKPDNLYADNVRNLVNSWLDHMGEWRWPNWVIGNHDQHRVASRLGNSKLVDAWNTLLLLLPGTTITYQGEELGMEDGNISWEDTEDPQACNGPEEGYEQRSRDPARTPFQWDDSKNAGFSDTDGKTWLPVADNFKTINVKVEQEAEKSHLKIYKALVQLRDHPAIQRGEFKMDVFGNILTFSRLIDNKGFAVAINFDSGESWINLEAVFYLTGDMKIAVSSLQSEQIEGDDGSGPLMLVPFDVVVISVNV